MGKDYLSIQIRVDQARKIAKNLFQVSGDVISLPGEKDFNFYIKSGSGNYLLRIFKDSRGDIWLGTWGAGLNRRC